MPRRRRTFSNVTEAVSLLKASLLASQLEACSLHLTLMPKQTMGCDDALRALDDARELLRALHPAAVDAASTRVMPPQIHRNELPVA